MFTEYWWRVQGGALTGTPHSSASAEALCRGRHPCTSMTLRPQPPLFHGELQSLESLMRCNRVFFLIQIANCTDSETRKSRREEVRWQQQHFLPSFRSVNITHQLQLGNSFKYSFLLIHKKRKKHCAVLEVFQKFTFTFLLE